MSLKNEAKVKKNEDEKNQFLIQVWYEFHFTSLESWKISELKNIYFYREILLLICIWGQSSMDIAFFTIQDWFQKLGVTFECKKTSLLFLRHYRKLFITQLIDISQNLYKKHDGRTFYQKVIAFHQFPMEFRSMKAPKYWNPKWVIHVN